MKIHRLFLFLVLSTSVLYQGCFVLGESSRKAYKRAEQHKPFDAIIVPGVPFKNGKWSRLMKARVVWSCFLYKSGYTKNIIYSGAAVHTPYKEAIIMGLYAQLSGIPEEHIFYDTLAKHSTENVYFSYLLAKNAGFKSLALTTDPAQSYALRKFIGKRFGTPIYRLPIIRGSHDTLNTFTPVIDPKSAEVENFVSIKNKYSFRRRLKGTGGKNINWNKYANGKVPEL